VPQELVDLAAGVVELMVTEGLLPTTRGLRQRMLTGMTARKDLMLGPALGLHHSMGGREVRLAQLQVPAWTPRRRARRGKARQKLEAVLPLVLIGEELGLVMEVMGQTGLMELPINLHLLPLDLCRCPWVVSAGRYMLGRQAACATTLS
jgi:hypothetical protein